MRRFLRATWRPITPETPPGISIAPVITGTLTAGSLLSVTHGTWTGNPTSYEYGWFRANDALGTGLTYTGAGSSYTLQVADEGKYITAAVRAFNAVAVSGVETFAVYVGPVAVTPTLAALALDDTSVPEDEAATINVTGATVGSTLTVLAGTIPAGMTLNSAARTIAGSPTTPGVNSFTLRETLLGATNTPRDTVLSITVVAATEGTALTAPTLTRTTGVTTYPPSIDFDRPVDWIDGISAVMQRSADPTFTTGVTEVVNTIYAATTTYDFGLSAVTSGSVFFRMAAWSGSRPVSLNWSNIVNVGDAVAPTITSANTQSSMSFSLTANEGVVWSIVGGADAGLWQISGSTCSHIAAGASQGSHSIIVRATDYAGNTADQTITITLDVTPAAFTFTDVASATTSTVYTSNTITVSGLGTGVAALVSITGGTYSKNGGTYTSSTGTAVNGDTFTVRQTSSASGATGTDATLTIGTVSDTYSVVTGGIAWATSLGTSRPSVMTVTGSPPATAEYTTGSAWGGIRANGKVIPDKFHLEYTLVNMADEFVSLGFDDGTNNFTNTFSLGNPWELPSSNLITLVDPTSSVSAWCNAMFARDASNGGIFAEAFGDNEADPWLDGDILVIEGQRSTGTMSFWRRRGGTTTFRGTGTVGTLGGNWWPVFVAFNNATKVTLNPGPASGFAVTPTSGYSAADGS